MGSLIAGSYADRRMPPLIAVGRVLLLGVEDCHRREAKVRLRDRTAVKRSYLRHINVVAQRAASAGPLERSVRPVA
jgi:hypothetical protein